MLKVCLNYSIVQYVNHMRGAYQRGGPERSLRSHPIKIHHCFQGGRMVDAVVLLRTERKFIHPKRKDCINLQIVRTITIFRFVRKHQKDSYVIESRIPLLFVNLIGQPCKSNLQSKLV